MTEQDIRNADWARALLFKVVKRALLQASFELAVAAQELKP